MALAANTKKMEALLEDIAKDLKKAMRGNKAAAQRVRTKTIRLEKLAKTWRRESIKTGFSKKKVAAKKKTTAKRKTAKRTTRKATKRVVRKAARKATRRPARKATRRRARR